MNRLVYILFSFAMSAVSAMDRFFDISLTTDFSNLKQRSHIDVNSQASFPVSSKMFILNPRISIYFDGTMDLSMASGLRHELPWGTLGHHVFWDTSALKNARFHQIGHSLDFLTPKFDYRLNYYHPITKEQISTKYFLSSHNWAEFEMTWKNSFCQIGLGPKYDFFRNEWGTQLRTLVPFKFFSIGSLLSYEKSNGFAGCFSLSFRLFSLPRPSFLHSPISHRSRVQYSKQVIPILRPTIMKRPDPLHPKKEPSEDNPIIVKSDDVEPPKEQEKDFFFRSQNRKTQLSTTSRGAVGVGQTTLMIPQEKRLHQRAS